MNALMQKKDEFLNVPLSTEMKEQVRRFSKANKMTMSNVARLALDEFLSSNFGKSKVKPRK